MKRIVRILLIIVIMGALGVLAARYWTVKHAFYYAGTLESTKIEISSQVASRIAKINFQEGDSVKEGDPLVELACEDIHNEAQFAQTNYERYKKLEKSGSASPETLETMETRKKAADIKVSWCKIQAPIAAQVLNRYHEPGEWVAPGSKLMSLSNTKDIWTYIYVPQTMIAQLSVGMKVDAILPELNSRHFEGRIIKINEEAEFTPKNVQTREERTRLVFGIKVSFLDSNTEAILKPGMTIEINL